MHVLIIGSGFGASAMAPAYASIGATTTVVSPRDEQAVMAALAQPADLVSIHSPPFLHVQHVMAALGMGRPVLCDKPFGRNATEAGAMRDRALALGLPHFLNFEFRQLPARETAKALITSGAIGRVRHIGWTMVTNGLRTRQHGWLFDADRGGGWIGAYVSHVIDSMRWLTGGEVLRCGGISRINQPARPGQGGTMQASTAEDALSAWFQFDECTASLDTAAAAAVTLPPRLTIMGDAGAIEIVDDDQVLLHRLEGTIEPIAVPTPHGGRHAASLAGLLSDVRDILEGTPRACPDFNDGVATALAMDMLRANLVPARLP